MSYALGLLFWGLQVAASLAAETCLDDDSCGMLQVRNSEANPRGSASQADSDSPHDKGIFNALATLFNAGNESETIKERLHDLGRPVNQGSRDAKSQFASRLQSKFEERYREIHGHLWTPAESHEMIMMIDEALEMIRMIEDGKSDAKNESAHATQLGYPLTVVEALAFATNLTVALGLDIPRDTAMGKIFLHFADILVRKGLWSDAAKSFYSSAVAYHGEKELPADAGWLNEFVGTLGTYTEQGGVHAYRKAPSCPPGNVDCDFAVLSMPKVDDRPLVIGVLADWGCGNRESFSVLAELKKLNPDVIIHLGDVYYSGTRAEARQFFLEPMVAAFGKEKMILQVPGNHDYYSEGGAGFFDVSDELGYQNNSFFVLRGEHWQILGIDTGVLDSFNLLFDVGSDAVKRQLETTMTFMPSDQAAWAIKQLEAGRRKGLKTIMMSHHQLFSRTEVVGVANSLGNEAAFLPDELHATYPWLSEFNKKSTDLPGNLPPDSKPVVNTRLLSQFPRELLGGLSAWFWGHEHSSAIFEPYAGLQKGRLIGNACIGNPKTFDQYGVSEGTTTTPWGDRHPEIINGSEVGTGDNFWNIGFATVTLEGVKATARYFELQDKNAADGSGPRWGQARMFYEEDL